MTAQEAFKEFIEANGLGIDPEDEDAFDESYRQEWESEEAFARYVAEELGCGGVPAVVYAGQEGFQRIEPFKELSGLIDWTSVARGLFRHGPYTFILNDEHPSRGYVFESEL